MWIDVIVNKKLWNKKLFQSKFTYRNTASINLLSSRLYCRLRNFTESCLAARGLYHR